MLWTIIEEVLQFLNITKKEPTLFEKVGRIIESEQDGLIVGAILAVLLAAAIYLIFYAAKKIRHKIEINLALHPWKKQKMILKHKMKELS